MRNYVTLKPPKMGKNVTAHSTLAGYAQALGGRLLVAVELPDDVVVPVWWGEPIRNGTEQ